MMRAGCSFCAARIVRHTMGKVPTRARGEYAPVRKMANVAPLDEGRAWGISAGVAVSFVVVSSFAGPPKSTFFLARVRKTRQRPPTTVQKNARKRLANANAIAVEPLRLKILPISMFPPSYVPIFPGLKLPIAFTSLVNASVISAPEKPTCAPSNQRTILTSSIAKHCPARFSEKLPQNSLGVLW